MKKKFIKNYNNLQILFNKLNNSGKLSDADIDIFNEIQLNFYSIYKKEFDTDTNIQLPWTDEDFKTAWEDWKKYKKQQFKFTYRPIGEKAALNDLVKVSDNNKDKAIELIKHARGKTWIGIFPIKQNNTKKTKSKKNGKSDIEEIQYT